MKRIFWLGVGVATGVALSKKAKETARQATPAGLAGNLGEAMRELAGAIGSFGADVRAGMVEREEELSDVVEERSGISPRARHALGESRSDAYSDRPARRGSVGESRSDAYSDRPARRGSVGESRSDAYSDRPARRGSAPGARARRAGS